MIDDEKFEQAKQHAEQEYGKISKVKCPYLNDFVHFNAEGLDHILFKTWSKPRSREEQYIRLRLLPLAVKLISSSHTLQEYEQRRLFVRVKSNSKWSKEMKLVKYYIFSAVMSNVLVKVVVREIEGRQKNFHSIIPKWRMDKDYPGKRILHTGNPEED